MNGYDRECSQIARYGVWASVLAIIGSMLVWLYPLAVKALQ